MRALKRNKYFFKKGLKAAEEKDVERVLSHITSEEAKQSFLSGVKQYYVRSRFSS